MHLSLLRVSLTLAVAALATPSIAQTCTSPIPTSDLTVPGKLQLSINPTLPPLQSVDSKGELQGVNVELGKEIAKRLCLQMDFQRMDFPAMIPGLQASRFDGIDTGMFWTEERSKIMFTVPYALSAIGVLVANDSKFKPAEPKDLLGHVVAVDADSYQERWLRNFSKAESEKGAKPMEIRAFITPTEVVAALRAGQADAAALPAYTTNEIAKRGQAIVAIKAMGATPITMAFRKKSVAEAVAKALNEMKKDGTYAKLLDEFGVPHLSEAEFAIRGPGPSS
ncbi:MAG TPA: ABC transporter substrate-binding protein [Pseudorhodoplanes sp.]|nr:ABC transporter substrate-binding protein [Pseudorhodoplanes sp.]